jgi:glycosyltransferase involved in cell wall biosynthesis
MKIIITTPYYPPHIGGIEVHAKNLARGIKRKGHEVEVITSIGKDSEVIVREVPSIHIPYSPIPIFFPEVSGEIYHSHVPSPFFARRIAKKHPHIVTYHNDVIVPERVDGRRIPNFIARWIEKKNAELIKPVLDSAELIIATTKSYAKTSPVLGRYMEKIEIVPNGVNVEAFQARDAGDRGAIVLYVGRLVEYKGLPVLLKAMKDVQSRIESTLVVIGEGEDRKRFENAAKKLKVKAEFKGRLPDEEVKKWVQKARTLVLPSKSRLEAFGIVLLEAMACKTPVIASRIPGVADIASEGGLTFEDENELAYQITEVLTNDSFATKLGRKGRSAVERKYTWDVVTNKIEKIYRSVA